MDWDYECQKNVGKIIIIGADDNSIPYEMFGWIESTFNTYDRHHLG